MGFNFGKNVLEPQQSVQLAPLPPPLAAHAEVAPKERFRTTTGYAHDRKHVDRAVYGNHEPLYKQAPALYNVHYNKDLHEKVLPNNYNKDLHEWSLL